MKLEFVEAFIDTTVRTLEQVLQTGFGRGDVDLIEGEKTEDGITVVIPLGGEVAGHVSLHLSDDTARKLSDHVTGQTNSTLSPMGRDCLNELGNMIAGAAASTLNDQGYELTVAPPVEDIAAHRAGQPEMEACQIPIFSEFGRLTVSIALTTE